MSVRPPAFGPAPRDWLAGALVALCLHAALLIAWGSHPLSLPATGVMGDLRIRIGPLPGEPGPAEGPASPARAAAATAPPATPVRAPMDVAARSPAARRAEPPPPPVSAAPPSAEAAPTATARDDPSAGEGAVDAGVAQAAEGEGAAGADRGGSGAEGGAAGSGTSDPDVEAYFQRLFGAARRSLERRYPRTSEQGVVLLRVSIDRRGRIEHCEVRESSGSRTLDRAAVRAFRRAGPFGPVPEGAADGDLLFDFPVQYELVAPHP